MKVKAFFGFIFVVVVSLMYFMWMSAPTGEIYYKRFSPQNHNFSSSTYQKMQFYENMRYADKEISYSIYNCSLKKGNDFRGGAQILSNLTILDFYETETDGEISVTCSERTKIKEGVFIAGEGGPTKIIEAGERYLILSGDVLLIRDSQCFNPNVAIHEILHALGFDHSSNKENIMYNFSFCSQEIGEDTINLINELYSYDGAPDLEFGDTSVSVHGKYVDANISIKNTGLKPSANSTLIIYADDKNVQEFELSNLATGEGIFISLTNVNMRKRGVDKIIFEIDSDEKELGKENNLLAVK